MDNLITNKVGLILDDMDSITLEEMDHVKLMQRLDTKFVIPAEKVPELLKSISTSYSVLEADGQRLHPYHTIYYDTPDFSMYHSHHNKRLNRYKIRFREYITSGIAYLEIKFKNNRQETIKKRIPPGMTSENSLKKSNEFIKDNSPYSAVDLKPSLQNYFKRITLVHIVNPERITIDLDLRYEDVKGEKKYNLPGLAVIEVKRNKESTQSEMIDKLHENHIRSMGFSKYCMGAVLTEEGIKKNLFRKRMRKLGKLEDTYNITQY